MLYSPINDLDTMARTVWGEARGERSMGRAAVAWVILNRYNSPIAWWKTEKGDGIPDGTIAAVCRDPYQFSCWLDGDPNLPRLLNVTEADPTFKECLEICRAVLEGRVPDPTQGAMWYYANYIDRPSWVTDLKPTVKIGRHIFLKKKGS